MLDWAGRELGQKKWGWTWCDGGFILVLGNNIKSPFGFLDIKSQGPIL